MFDFSYDWIHLLARWMHLIFGIAWIGASFYFVWLDLSLREPPKEKKDKGIGGDLWAIHGGGFYEIGKYKVAPQQLPKKLHWFKWEAYSTAISGIFLLIWVFYLNANAYLIDPNIATLSTTSAIGIGLAFVFGGWVVYDLLCKSPLKNNGYLLGLVLVLAITLSTFILTNLFTPRAAFIHIGAMIGIWMVGNVAMVIIPGQRELVRALKEKRQPEAKYAISAKLRSTHNTYLTLPVLFIMISNHYPMIYTHPLNWLLLALICLVSAIARHYFILKHQDKKQPIYLIVAAIGFVLIMLLAAATQPKNTSTTNTPILNSDEAMAIISARCTQCHSVNPSDDIFSAAPGGVNLDNLADVERWKKRIIARTITSHDMPFANKTNMTQEERDALALWFESH